MNPTTVVLSPKTRAARRFFPMLRLSLLALVGAPLVAACGPQLVQVYDGDKLPDDQVTFLFTNPNLTIVIDRAYTVSESDRGKLQRLELKAWHHAVEVNCHYPDAQHTVSPSIPLVADGEPGHVYKPRVRFKTDAAGVPGCHVRMFDITSDPAGKNVDLY